MSAAEQRALAWALAVLDDAMEYPRAGDGWPHYSADEATADAILRAAGYAWRLPVGDNETPDQRAEREASEAQARIEAERLEAERVAQARRYAEAEAQRLRDLQRAEWRLAWDVQRRDLRDARGVRVARVERHLSDGRMSSLGGWSQSTRAAEPQWRAEDLAPVEWPLVDTADSVQLGRDLWPIRAAASDWLPADAAPSDGEAGGLRDLGAGLERVRGYIPPRVDSRARDYWDDAGAARIWVDLLGDAPDAQQAAEWARRRAEKAARKAARAEPAVTGAFAALAAWR